jgi:hypothetical protein
MWKFSELVFQWLPENQWNRWICADLREVVDILKNEGISILKVGEENYKSPTGLIFTDKPFDTQAVLNKLSETNKVVGSEKFSSTLVCDSHFTSLMYEDGLK